MHPPVFISYARKTSREEAEALQRQLGESVAFLDTSNIEAGEHFPKLLADALLGAKVVVVFADETYFRRWYCLWELRTALAPFLALAAEAGETKGQDALSHIILALPSSGRPPEELERLPPPLRATHWYRASEIRKLADLVRARVEATRWTLGERLKAMGAGRARVRTQLLEEAALPPPMNLASLCWLYPLERPPSLGKSFVGRANALWRIDFLLSTTGGSKAQGGAPIGTLEGMGGIGKTRLALEYVHRLGPRRFPGGVFWVDADVDEDRLEEQLHGILRTLRPQVPALPVFRQKRRDAATEVARALHESSTLRPILYVVDNVPEPGAGAAAMPLKKWCPAVGKVTLLVTSRSSVSVGEQGAQALPLGVLDPESAVALLTEDVREVLPAGFDWYRIAEWVGHLPLALELLNRSLRTGAVSVAELWALVRQRGPALELDEQMDALREQVPPGALRGVTEAFNISYERLSRPARRLAHLVARLAPKPIPMAVMEALEGNVFSRPARTALRSRHFVTPVVEGPVSYFGVMHRVLADFLCSKSKKPDEELRLLCESLVTVMEAEKAQDPREWPLLNASLPHAEQVFEGLLGTGPRSSARAGYVLALGLRVALLLKAWWLPERARDIEKRVLGRSLQQLGTEHPDTLMAMGNISATMHLQGELTQALIGQTLVLEMSRRVLGETHPDTLTAMNNLAETLHAQGNLAGARSLQEQVLEVSRRTLGEKHSYTLTAMNNLAQTLSAQGAHAEARALAEQVLEVRRQMLGEEHAETLLAMGNLAAILHEQGDLRAARTLEERVLEVRRSLFGEEHLNTLTAMNNLAQTLHEQGDLPGARALEQRVLEVIQRVLGDKHLYTLTAMNNLARTLRAQGDVAGARALEERVEQHSSTPG